MLCLSGFDLYSRWVPLMRTETQKKDSQPRSQDFDGSEARLRVVSLRSRRLEVADERENGRAHFQAPATQASALFASCEREIIFPRFMGSRLPE